MALDVIFFELRGRRCALPLRVVREVLPMPGLTPVPLAPTAVRGVAPLHGQALPVLDLGVWFSATKEAVFRTGDKVLVIETPLAGEPAPVRAALAVERVTRLGCVDVERSRPPPPGPGFVSATVLDVEGPALLVDPEKAMEEVRDAIAAGVSG